MTLSTGQVLCDMWRTCEISRMRYVKQIGLLKISLLFPNGTRLEAKPQRMYAYEELYQ